MQLPLDKVDDLTTQLKLASPITIENKQRLDKKFRLEFNYNSNHMEGNTLTYGETELLLIFGDTKGNHQMREYEEMKAHDVAYQLVEEWAKDKERPLTEQNIKELNKTILIRPFWKDAITATGENTRRQIKVGEYKEYPNAVRLSTGELFEYASPTETPILMQELIDWYRSEESVLHPATLATMLHYKFVRIHPFDDGNGRIARLLMNYVLLRNNLPPVIIKSDDKANYLHALHSADVGDYPPLIEYIANQLIWSLEISIKAAKGEDIEEATDLQKEISLLSKRLTTEEKLSKHPAIVLEVFSWFSKDLWPEIQESLEQFDSLFAEIKESKFVNHKQVILDGKRLFEPIGLSISKNFEPKDIKILGYDIYKEEINRIDWNVILYGLRGAKTKPEMEINATLEFKTDIYNINIMLDNRSLSSTDYRYGDFILKSDIEKLQNFLAKQVLEEIKTRVK
ncbi:Fic family protein [Pedobacter steynii]|uniref:Fic family protein n=1 Tax=Pedobacter steynii TaxID=430522 RepID=A0A1H0HC51_9SPHI|nr:Fic family protein [Pedobacter steynii]NQX42658.1 Fic family protein [Pedobacter steynii]SDO16722.1 Fic family protein [Pedobacter steynii]